jgi:excisionase family DNA binding protein
VDHDTPTPTPENTSWQTALIECAHALNRTMRDLAHAASKDPDELLTAEDLADLFHLSARTLKEQAAANRIPHHRFGKHYRFSRQDIAEILRLSQQANTIPIARQDSDALVHRHGRVRGLPRRRPR